MQAPKRELTKEELEIRNSFENEDLELLKCPHCGEMLEEIIVRRLEYTIESYCLTKYGIEYYETIDNEFYDDSPYNFFCKNCDAELSKEFIDKLEDKDLINI